MAGGLDSGGNRESEQSAPKLVGRLKRAARLIAYEEKVVFYDDDVLAWLELYNLCALGTSGMDFNWPSGSWQDEDVYTIQVFQLIAAEFGKVSEEKRKAQENSEEAMKGRELLNIALQQAKKL